MSERHSARRVLGEVGIIVVGVLVALLAESAWAERGARVEERQYLESLAADLELEVRELAQDRAWLDFVIPISTEAEGVLLGDSGLTPEGGLAVLYGAALIRSPNLEMGSTWSDLRASGRLSLIQDDALRRALVAYYASYELLLQERDDLPSEYRSIILGILPTQYTLRVLAECARDPDGGVGADAPPRPDVLVSLPNCSVAPRRGVSGPMSQMKAEVGARRALAELSYNLTRVAEFLDRAETSLGTLQALLQDELSN